MRCVEKLEDRRLLTTYTVTDLSGAGLAGLVADLNDAGQVAGTVAGHAVRWQGGVAADLGTLGGPTSAAAAINSRGDVVGTASSGAAGPSVASLWKDGVIRDLGLGADSAAVAVNDTGVVAANAGGRAFVWRDGVVTDLGDLGGGGAAAAHINNAGTVVGSSWAGGYDRAIGLPSIHALIWRDSVMTDLGTPAFTLSSYTSAVNNAGQVVGSSTVYVNTGYGA